MNNPLFELLSQYADSDRPLICNPSAENGSATLSYADFFQLVSRTATALLELGIRPGDRVALQATKSVEALAVYLGCVQTGAAFLPLNTAYTAREIDYFLNDASVSVFITDPDSPLVQQNKDNALAENCRVLSLDGHNKGSFAEAVSKAKPSDNIASRNPTDLGAILYTSGTTGRSKGAMLSQENLASNTRVLLDYWQFTEDDCLLHALPIYHTHGLFVACNVVLATGASMIFHAAFNVDQVIQDLPAANTMMGVPTFYTRLLDDPRFDSQISRHMRLFTSGSAPMLAETHIAFEQRTGQRILERYGMTETGMLTSNPYASQDGPRKAGTVGTPLPGVELRIVDSGELDDEDPASQTGSQAGSPSTSESTPKSPSIGMIEVKGPNVFSGYWNMPEKTAEEFRDDCFFITGDLGFTDEDGYVTIVGRNKDLIITGGFNVYPKEVESLIDEKHGIKESAVIGLSHKDFGEAVTAVLVLDKSIVESDGEHAAAAIINNVEQELAVALAKFKQPKQYLVLDELPRNTMGKVQKNILRDKFEKLYLDS